MNRLQGKTRIQKQARLDSKSQSDMEINKREKKACQHSHKYSCQNGKYCHFAREFGSYHAVAYQDGDGCRGEGENPEAKELE